MKIIRHKNHKKYVFLKPNLTEKEKDVEKYTITWMLVGGWPLYHRYDTWFTKTQCSKIEAGIGDQT